MSLFPCKVPVSGVIISSWALPRTPYVRVTCTKVLSQVRGLPKSWRTGGEAIVKYAS